ncbi:MAG: NADH dehydrogenase (quinone) subunit D [Leptospirales bacterium]|nr:NADH dehydrogenase (quinone) subunit D [Leptospirales bacterium]
MYSYQSDVLEKSEDSLLLNVGPSHPATHGTLRLKLKIQGETVVGCEQEIGFLHTGFEKLGEHRSFNQFVTITDRMNYISPLNNNIGYAVAVEELLGIEVPRRCAQIRVILAELSRIADHIFSLGAMTMDMGAFSSILWAFVEREKLYDVFESVTGTRLTTSYTRVGGLAFDLPEGFEARVREILDEAAGTIDKFRASFLSNPIFLERTSGVGVITREDALNFGLTGPIARASGVDYDLRKFRPYLGYQEYDFDTPIYAEGDSYARYVIRLDEMDESIRIVRQALDRLEPGPINYADQKHVLPDKQSVYHDMESLIHHFKVIMPGGNHGVQPPKASHYSASEAPNGELGFYLVSDGGSMPYRVRVRPPSFYNFQVYSKVLTGRMVADLVTILASFNVIAGELDR